MIRFDARTPFVLYVLTTAALAQGSPQPTTWVADLPSSLVLLGEHQGRLIVSLEDPATGREPWSLDAQGQLSPLGDLSVGPDSTALIGLTSTSSGYYFVASTPATGSELWVTDGTPAGTQQVIDLWPGPDSGVNPFVGVSGAELEGRFYFPGSDGQGNDGLYSTLGTASSTVLAVSQGTDLNGASVPLEVGALFGGSSMDRAGDRIVFTAKNLGGFWGGSTAWSTDGTDAGTYQIPPESNVIGIFDSFSVTKVTAWGDRAVFTAYSNSAASSLPASFYVTDGTVAGTKLLEEGYDYGAFVPMGRWMTYIETIVSIETPIGFFNTYALRGIDSEGDLIYSLLGGWEDTEFYFGGSNGETALWVRGEGFAGAGGGQPASLVVTDGSPLGTTVWPFPGIHGNPLPPFGFSGGAVGDSPNYVFSAESSSVGLELWQVDPAAGTTAVAYDAGPGDSRPQVLGRLDDSLFMTVTAASGGFELHSISVSGAGGHALDEFGAGCGSRLLGVGTAQLGTTPKLRVEDAPPFSPTVMFFDDSPAWASLSPACQIHLAVPKFYALGVADAAGVWEVPTPIPVIPSLVGAVTYKQAASYSPGGPALGDWVLTNGLEYLLGN